jgi:uncharacterized protein (DUF2062 family)
MKVCEVIDVSGGVCVGLLSSWHPHTLVATSVCSFARVILKFSTLFCKILNAITINNLLTYCKGGLCCFQSKTNPVPKL